MKTSQKIMKSGQRRRQISVQKQQLQTTDNDVKKVAPTKVKCVLRCHSNL